MSDNARKREKRRNVGLTFPQLLVLALGILAFGVWLASGNAPTGPANLSGSKWTPAILPPDAQLRARDN